MTKRYKLLRNKLRDLESELTNILSLSSECELSSRIESVHTQFLFLKTLLSAEISSNPSKPRHLSHISNRLAELQAFFDEMTFESHPVQNGSYPAETGSVCSCTDSCLNDDGDSEMDQAFFDFEPEEEEEEKEELFYEAETGQPDPTRVCDEKRKWGNNGTVLAGGVVIGALLMGICGDFYGCFYSYISYQGSLVPT